MDNENLILIGALGVGAAYLLSQQQQGTTGSSSKQPPSPDSTYIPVPTQIGLSRSSNSIQAGDSITFVATVLDQMQHGMANVSVSFITAQASTPVITNASGTATLTQSFSSPGDYHIYAAAGGVVSNSLSFSVSSPMVSTLTGTPRITLSSGSIPKGGFVTISGTGFSVLGPVQIDVYMNTINALVLSQRTTSDIYGNFSYTFSPPYNSNLSREDIFFATDINSGVVSNMAVAAVVNA